MEVKTMQDRDFSKYYVAEDDGMIWLDSSKDWDGTTPVFSTQEEFAKAYSQCKEFSLSKKTSLLLNAKPIANDFNNKTDDEVRQMLNENYSDKHKDVDYEDTLIGILLDYNLYMTAINGNEKIFNESKDEIIPDASIGYSRDKIRENNYNEFEFIGGQQEHMYYYINEEFGLGDEVVRCFLTENETEEFNKLTEEYNKLTNESIGDDKEIIKNRQLLIMLAGVRCARKLVEE